MKESIIWIIILLIVGYILFFNKRENLTPIDSSKQEMSLKIQDFLKVDTNYIDYINFLRENKNTSYALIDEEIFYEMKYLLKQNKLNATEILKYMTDVI